MRLETRFPWSAVKSRPCLITASPAQTAVSPYEPVWAIGTGLTPTVEDVAEMHTAIRETLAGAIGAEEAGRVRLLYGDRSSRAMPAN